MKLLNEVQENKFQAISGYLKQARENKSLSIEEVAMATLVPMAALKAIDEGKVEKLPEAIYVQGFIRRYGDAVGLNGKELAAQFAEACLPLPEPVDFIQSDGKDGLSLSLLAPYAIFLSLLAAASVGLFFLLNPQRGGESVASKTSNSAITSKASSKKPAATKASVTNINPTTTSTSQPATKSPETTATTSPTTQPTTDPITNSTPSPASTPTTSPTPTTTPTDLAPPVSSPVSIKLDIKEEAWVRVKVDGKVAYEGTLKPGEMKNWTGNKVISIESGNAGGVLVSENDQPAQPMGKSGAIARRNFQATPDATPSPTP